MLFLHLVINKLRYFICRSPYIEASPLLLQLSIPNFGVVLVRSGCIKLYLAEKMCLWLKFEKGVNLEWLSLLKRLEVVEGISQQYSLDLLSMLTLGHKVIFKQKLKISICVHRM